MTENNVLASPRTTSLASPLGENRGLPQPVAEEGRVFRSRAIGVGPLRKYAGGMFSGSDRSGYAARSNPSGPGMAYAARRFVAHAKRVTERGI